MAFPAIWPSTPHYCVPDEFPLRTFTPLGDEGQCSVCRILLALIPRIGFLPFRSSCTKSVRGRIIFHHLIALIHLPSCLLHARAILWLGVYGLKKPMKKLFLVHETQYIAAYTPYDQDQAWLFQKRPRCDPSLVGKKNTTHPPAFLQFVNSVMD